MISAQTGRRSNVCLFYFSKYLYSQDKLLYIYDLL